MEKADAYAEGRASLAYSQKIMQESSAKIENMMSTAEETLAASRATLERWDRMKENFGKALDTAIHRIADAMKEEQIAAPEGPPKGVTAHGTDGNPTWIEPRMVVECNEVARPAMKQAIKAHEYKDDPSVLRQKVRLLAEMIRRSKHTVAYTGAGISTAAGIGDYASKSGARSSVLPKKLSSGDPFNAANAINAEPTFAHRALVSMHAAGRLAEWVQQK